MRLGQKSAGLSLYPTIGTPPPFVPPTTLGPYIPVDLSDPIKARPYFPHIDYQRDLSLLSPPVIGAQTFRVPAGHYVQVQHFHWDAGSQTECINLLNAAEVGNNGNAPTGVFRGIEKYAYMHDIDLGSAAGPNFSVFVTGFGQVLARAQQLGKFVGFGVYDHGAGNSATNSAPTTGQGVIPDYFINKNWASSGLTNQAPPIVAARWEQTGGVVGWFKAFVDAMSIYDGHPALAWLNIPILETSLQVLNTGNNANGVQMPIYNFNNDYAACLAILTYARQKMPKTLFRYAANYMIINNATDQAMVNMFQNLFNLTGIIIGSTDPEGSRDPAYPTGTYSRNIMANEIYRGNDRQGNAGVNPDWRGRLLWNSGVQSNVGWTSTMTPIQMFQQNQGIMHNIFQCWQNQEQYGNAGQKYSTGIKPYVISIGGAISGFLPSGDGASYVLV